MSYLPIIAAVLAAAGLTFFFIRRWKKKGTREGKKKDGKIDGKDGKKVEKGDGNGKPKTAIVVGRKTPVAVPKVIKSKLIQDSPAVASPPAVSIEITTELKETVTWSGGDGLVLEVCRNLDRKGVKPKWLPLSQETSNSTNRVDGGTLAARLRKAHPPELADPDEPVESIEELDNIQRIVITVG